MSKVENLVEAARAELIAGHRQCEMQAVAKRANVSVGLAYHHFGSKVGLTAAVVEAFYQRGLGKRGSQCRCTALSVDRID